MKILPIQAPAGRRTVLRGAGLATMTAALGAAVPFAANLKPRFVPAAFAADDLVAGKDGFTMLGDRPLNAETPPHLLDDAITPTAR